MKVKVRKRKTKSQGQVLNDLSEGLQKISQSMEKRISSIAEKEQRREEALMKFHERQSEFNRQHEMRMIEMMMRFNQASPAMNIHPHGMGFGGASFFTTEAGTAYNSFGTSPSEENFLQSPSQRSYQNL